MSGSDVPPQQAAEVRRGVADCATVGLGLIPLGVAFGVLVTQSGFAWWWAPVFSVLIYAGSMEFLALGLLTALTPLYGLAATTFLVNFRHVFYGLSFPLHRIHGPAKWYAVYALTDETYAITSTINPDKLSGVRAVTIAVTCQLLWVIPGTVGALVGSALPEGLDELDFALTALFAVLALDAWHTHRDLPAPAIALVSGLVAMYIAPGSMLVVALGLFVAALIVRYLLIRRASSSGNGNQR